MENKPSIISRFVILGGLILIIFIGYYTFHEIKRTKGIEEEIEAQKQEAERIRNSNKALEEKIAYFETSDYKEKIAKDKFNLKKEGEKVVVIKRSPSSDNLDVDKKDLAETEKFTDENRSKETEEGKNIIKWWNYFFKY